MLHADTFSSRANRRIARLTLAIGLAVALLVAAAGHPGWALGIAGGTLLAWINHRWLDQITATLMVLSTSQPDGPRPQVPTSTYVKMAGRYFLLGLAAYAIVKFLEVPIPSILTGLLALGAAAIAESLYEVFAHPR